MILRMKELFRNLGIQRGTYRDLRKIPLGILQPANHPIKYLMVYPYPWSYANMHI